jgi:hypothetical protein
MGEIIFDETEDWEKRILCSDEACIGTIGPDGKCKACGKVYEGDSPSGHGATNPQTLNAEDQNAAPPEDADCDDDWDKRVLCSDGACIGVIGPNGKCKDCGKPLQ